MDTSHFTARVDADTLNVTFQCRTLDDGNVAEFADRIDQLADQHPGHLVRLDFDRVTFLNSSVLNRLAMLAKRTRKLASRLRLVNLDPNLRELFKVTRLDTLMEVRAKGEREESDAV